MAAMVISGCIPYKKQVYFQYLEERAADSVATYATPRSEYKLQVDDIIDIKITSPSEDGAMFFDQTFRASTMQNMNLAQMAGQGGDLFYLTGYIINDSGFVQIPVLGNVPAAGLSVAELKRTLETRLLEYFTSRNSFYVGVKLGGLRYSVLGEVARPGRYVVLENRYNIYQALAQVGDLTAFANRNQVWLIRQEGGSSRVYSIDLMSEKLMTSPLFYIQPNDVIYVRPLKAKMAGFGSTFLQNLSSIASLLSLSLSMYIAYLTLQNQQ
jgi:polysaccharide export outer membrane protein